MNLENLYKKQKQKKIVRKKDKKKLNFFSTN